MIGFKFEFPKRNAIIHVVFEKEKKQSIWDLVMKLYQDFKDSSDAESDDTENDKKEEPAVEQAKEAIPKEITARAKSVPSVTANKKKTSPVATNSGAAKANRDKPDAEKKDEVQSES